MINPAGEPSSFARVLGCQSGLVVPIEGAWRKPKPLRRAAVWKASDFWMEAPGDETVGDQKFATQSNMFEHMSVR